MSDTKVHVWTDRDEWAKRTRTFYGDIAQGARDSVSSRVLDYATQQEVATAVAELRDRWKALGRRLRELNKQLQPYDGHREFYQLSSDQQRMHSDSRDLSDLRQWINKVAKDWENPRLGTAYLDHAGYVGQNGMAKEEACPTYRAITGRWYAAQDAAEEAARIRTENQPIDDAAWSRELKRRADLEEYFRRGPQITRVNA
jgi:hypothetical protein